MKPMGICLEGTCTSGVSPPILSQLAAENILEEKDTATKPGTQHTAQFFPFSFSSSLALASLQPLLNERTIMTFIHHHSWFYRHRRHGSTWQPDRQCKWATCASSFVCQDHSRDISTGFDAVWAKDSTDGAAMLMRKMAGWGGGRGVLVMCSLELF